MKNEIIFSYRLIKLIYYLIALYVAITYVNEISKAICYILILVLILGCAMYIYLIIVYKIYSKSINLEKNIKKYTTNKKIIRTFTKIIMPIVLGTSIELLSLTKNCMKQN